MAILTRKHSRIIRDGAYPCDPLNDPCNPSYPVDPSGTIMEMDKRHLFRRHSYDVTPLDGKFNQSECTNTQATHDDDTHSHNTEVHDNHAHFFAHHERYIHQYLQHHLPWLKSHKPVWKVSANGHEAGIICRNVTIDIGLLCFVVFLVAIQFALFDYYFVMYGFHQRDLYVVGDGKSYNCDIIVIKTMEQDRLGYEFIYYFIVPDLVAIGAMAALPLIQYLKRVKAKREKKECRHALANIRFACISWLIYASVFNAKIVYGSMNFIKVLQFLEECDFVDEEKMTLGVNAFVIVLSGCAVVFLFLVLSHHAHNAEAKEILHKITDIVTFDVLDGVQFLQILFSTDEIEFLYRNPYIEDTIVALACVNFLLPTISLLRLFDRLTSLEPHAVRKRILKRLIEEDLYTAMFLLLVNLPYLAMRCYLWYGMDLGMSVFVLKNAIMPIIQIRQIFIYSRRLWRAYRASKTVPEANLLKYVLELEHVDV